jgi:hypothetical protein
VHNQLCITHEDAWGSGVIAPPLLTWALDGSELLASRPAALSRYPLYRGLGGPQSRSGSCGIEKNLLPLPVIKPLPPARRYTDWALLKYNSHSFIHSFIHSSALCWALASSSVSFFFTQSVGLLGWVISPSQGRYLHTGQHKRTQTSMPWVVFEPTIPASERVKTAHALDRAATVLGKIQESP